MIVFLLLLCLSHSRSYNVTPYLTVGGPIFVMTCNLQKKKGEALAPPRVVGLLARLE